MRFQDFVLSPVLLLVVLLDAGLMRCHAATVAETPTTLRATTLAERIEAERQEIASAVRDGQTGRLGYLWATLGADLKDAGEFVAAEDAYSRALNTMKSDPAARANYAATLSNLGGLYLLYARLDEAESCLKKALAIRLELGDAVKAAYTRQHLADLALARHKYKQAEAEASQAYEVLTNPSVKGEVQNPTAVSSLLVTLAYARCDQKKCDEGLRDAQRAVEITEASLPAGSVQIGYALLALGFAQWKALGDQQADDPMRRGIEMIRAQIVPGNPVLTYALHQYREYLKSMRRSAELRRVDDEIDSKPPTCMNCSISVESLSKTLR